MDDLETSESPDSGAGGGLGSFLNDTSNVISAVTGLIVGRRSDDAHARGQRPHRAEEQDPNGIESGNVGIRAGSSESFVTLRFEDFVLRYL